MSCRGGIDPGKKGFICWMIGKKIEYLAMPKIGKEFDIMTTAKKLANLKSLHPDLFFVLEAVNADPKWGAKNNFSFGEGNMLFKTLLTILKIPFVRTNPKKWQKEMFEGIPIQKKPSSTGKTMVNDTKKMAEMAVQRLFPDEDMKRTKRCTTLDDNKIDALLIAEYCRRIY